MEAASPLLLLPEEIWTCIVLPSLTDIRDRVSACLASRRLFMSWGSSVFQGVQGRHVALTAGRFMQRSDVHAVAPQLQFQLERRGPRYEWMQLLARFLACCAPAGYEFRSFLHPCPDGSTLRPCRSGAKPATSSRPAHESDQMRLAAPSARDESRRQAGPGPMAGAAAEPLAAPCVWVSLPPGFQPNLQQQRDVASGGYCVGHLPTSTSGTSICLLMSGAASAYYFELPSLRVVLSVDKAERTAEARLELCHIRPVLRPGVDVWELPP